VEAVLLDIVLRGVQAPISAEAPQQGPRGGSLLGVSLIDEGGEEVVCLLDGEEMRGATVSLGDGDVVAEERPVEPNAVDVEAFR
jgi:hypothetical protein